MTLTQIKPAGLSTPVDLADNARIRLGTGNDLQIYHDGSNSYIEDAGTGVLLIKSNTLYLTGTNAANDLASFVEGGAVSLYYDDVKKFETTSSGISVLGGGSTFLKLGNVAGATDSVFLDTTHASNAKPNMDFKLDGDLALRIDSSGRLILGAVSTADTGSYYDDITINNSNTASGAAGGAGLSIVTGDSSFGGVIFSRSGSHGRGYIKYGQAADQLVFGTQTIDRLMIEDSVNNGDIHVKTGNLKFDTAGRGIDFSATSDASGKTSELLDDYEEGTWTPAGINFTVQSIYSAHYTKIGNVVFIQMYVQAATGSGVSAISVSGLPYTVKGSNYYSYAACRIGGSASQGYDKVFQINSGSTNMTAFIADGHINEGMISGQHLIMSGFYHVA